MCRALFKASLVLLPLLGLTWVFGILSVNANSTIFAWLFTIFNSLQVLLLQLLLPMPCGIIMFMWLLAIYLLFVMYYWLLL